MELLGWKLEYPARTFLFRLPGGRPLHFFVPTLSALGFSAASKISAAEGNGNSRLPLGGTANTEYVAGGSLEPRFDCPVMYSIRC